MKRVGVIIKFIGYLAFFSILILIASHYLGLFFSLADLKVYIKSFGFWAPLVLVLFIILTSSIGLIFTIPVAIAALLLGVWGAFFISIIGLSIGASISFIIARFFGRPYIEKKYVHKIKPLRRYNEHLRRIGFLTVLFFRFISLIPFELVNIAAGLSKVRFRDFLLGTLIGIMPGTLFTIFLINSTTDIHSMKFFVATTLYAFFSLFPLIFKRVRKIVF